MYINENSSQAKNLHSCDLLNKQTILSVTQILTCNYIKVQVKSNLAIIELWHQKELLFLFYLLFFQLPQFFFAPANKLNKKQHFETTTQTLKCVGQIQSKKVSRLLQELFLRLWSEQNLHTLSLHVSEKNRYAKLNFAARTSSLFYDKSNWVEFFLFKTKYHLHFSTTQKIRANKQITKILILNCTQLWSIQQ